MTSLVIEPQQKKTASRTMSAAVLVEPKLIQLVQVAVPEPEPQEIRVRLEGCGVCASNLSPWEGKPWFTYPFDPGALGHEGWGIVDATGSEVSEFQKGDRVAILSSHSYAEYDLAKSDSAIKLPPSLEGQPFPAEPLACAMNVFRRSEISSGSTVAVVGVGFLGAILCRLASVAGAHVIAISRRQYALAMARQMGAERLIPMKDHWQIIEQLKKLTNGKFCDVVIEATGLQWPLDLAAEITRERGRLVIAGYHQDGPRQVNMQLWNWRGIDVINAHEREPQIYLDGMKSAVKAVSSGILDPSPLYTHTFPLTRLGQALEMTHERPDGFFKALIKF